MRVLLGVLFALAAVLAPSASSSDPSRVEVGRAIGAVRIGIPEAAVVAALGEPASTSTWEFRERSGPIAEYAPHDGKLIVYYDSGRVVAVETTSRRYRLRGNVGVGTITPRRTNPFSFRWRGFRYDECTAAYLRGAYSAVTELLLQSGPRIGRRIVALAIARNTHRFLSPGANRCD